MKKPSIKRYRYQQLSATAKQKALLSLHDINLTPSWQEGYYEDFIQVAAACGLTVIPGEVYVHHPQGRRESSAYAGRMDAATFLAALASKAWQAHAPGAPFAFCNTAIDDSVRVMLWEKRVTVSLVIETAKKNTAIRVYFGAMYTYRMLADFPGFEANINALSRLMKAACHELNAYLLTLVRQGYADLTSDTAITNAIDRRGLWFTSDGEPINP